MVPALEVEVYMVRSNGGGGALDLCTAAQQLQQKQQTTPPMTIIKKRVMEPIITQQLSVKHKHKHVRFKKTGVSKLTL